jgi:hypothetical protein
MLTVSRRGLLALGGTGAATVLAGCGSEPDPRAESDDQQLLTNAYAAEVDLQTAYDALARDAGAGDDSASVIGRSQRASSERQAELGSLGASAGQSQSNAGSADGADTGLGPSEAAANAAIAAYRQCAGLLPEAADRATTMGFLAQVAAELAAIRGLFGADQVPEAFVTGGSEPPFVAEAQETTTTSTTSTSTTSTDEP